MDTKEKQKLKRFIRELSLIRGRHTELVSVYIPAGYEIHKIIHHLEQEKGTASNIKDAKTRNHVISSLEKAIRQLRLFKRTPPNGYVVFAGNASEKESQVDIKVWGIEPPEPLNLRLYRCDQTFLLEPLKQFIETKDMHGLIVMDRREATVGVLRGSTIKVLSHRTSGVPGKTRAGGQCVISNTLVNNGKLIEIKNINVGDKIESYDLKENKLIDSICLDKWNVKKENYYIIKTEDKKIITSKDHIFFVKNNNEIKQKSAEELTTKDFLIERNCKTKIKSIELINKEIELIDIAVKQGNFFANNLLVHNSAARYERLREGAAKEFFKRISETVNKEFLAKKEIKGILIGGPGHTKEEFKEYLNQEIKKKIIAIKDLTYTDESGLHDLVSLSQEALAKEQITHEKKLLEKFFTLLAKSPEKVAYGEAEVKKALEFGAVDTLLISEDVDDKKVEEFEQLAEKTRTILEIISTETREGQQLKDLGGIAAILRYAIQ